MYIEHTSIRVLHARRVVGSIIYLFLGSYPTSLFLAAKVQYTWHGEGQKNL
jgi:hypothetical protein